MLDRIRDRQWALADIDWEAPGAECIAEKQFEHLRRFMTDLVWIEQIGARGFAGLARQAPDPTLAEIYRYFHAEEQRHANAELALMRRWGMLDDGRVPEPNINVRLAIDWLEANADDLPLEALGTVIPMLEVALDGALVKFLLDEVRDPLCHEVFEKINNDESRHLVIDFHVLEVLGAEHVPRSRLRARIDALRPSTLIGGIISLPLFARIGRSVTAMGLDKQRLLRSLSRRTKSASSGSRLAASCIHSVSRSMSPVSLPSPGTRVDRRRTPGPSAQRSVGSSVGRYPG